MPDGIQSDAKEIGSSKNNVTIIKCRYAPKGLQLLTHQAGGIPAALKYKPWLYLLLPLLIFSLFFYTLIQAKRHDVIHANWSINTFITLPAHLLFKIPIITTIRGEDIARAEKKIIDLNLLKFALNYSDKVIAVGESILNRTVTLLPQYKHKLRLINNGIDRSLLEITRANEIQKQTLYQLVTVGSLIKRKSFHTIISALKDCENCHLSIIGEGPEKNALESQCKSLGLFEHVTFLGNVDPDSITNKLARADVFIFASLDEGRPNALLEAMATGLPVIASNIESHKEIITDETNGLLFETGNSGHLSEKIQLLLSNQELRVNLGLAGRNFIIAQELTWEKCASQYIQAYSDALSA